MEQKSKIVHAHAVQFEFTAIFRTHNSTDTATDRRKAATLTDLSTAHRSLVLRASQHRGHDIKPRDHVIWVSSKIVYCCRHRRREIMGSG